MCGALSSTLLDRMASSIRTKSPFELVTTADRMALAPLGTPTRDGASLKSDGMSHAVVVHSSSLLALNETGLRAAGVGTNASTASEDNATAAATEDRTFIACNK